MGQRRQHRDTPAAVLIGLWILIVTAGTAPGGGGVVGNYVQTVADLGAYALLMAAIAVALAAGAVDQTVQQAPWMQEVVVAGASVGQLLAVVLPAWTVVGAARWWRRPRTRSPIVFTGAFRRTWAAMRDHVARYLGLVLLTLVGILAAEETVSAFEVPDRPIAWALAVMAWVIHVLSGAMVLRLALALVDGRSLRIWEAIPAPRTLMRFGVLCELWTAATLLGVSALLLPGIVWAIASCFAGLLVVEQRVGFFAALRQSARLTRGLRWRLFKLGALWLPTSVLFGTLRHLSPGESGRWPLGEVVHAFLLPAITILLCVAYRRVGVDDARHADPVPAPHCTVGGAAASASHRDGWASVWWAAPDIALAGGWTLAALVPVLASLGRHLP